jgi:mono/diheme cytochrome c family protein
MKARISGVGTLVSILGLIGMTTGCTLFDSEFVATGRKLFNYYCADCHGATGGGNGYNAEFLDPRPRDLTDSKEKYLAEQTNEKIYETLSRDLIDKGEVIKALLAGRKLTFVPPLMPTFKYTLSDAERWSIVAYVRTLHKNDAPKIELTPEMNRERPRFARITKVNLAPDSLNNDGQITSGKKAYEKYGCRACHSLGGENGRIGPALDRAGFMSNAQWLYRWVKDTQAVDRRTKMPTVGLSDEEASALVAYLKTLRAPAAVAAAADRPRP